tara:strand:- start:225 stop:596 length:372 start_codon:yes stop_codon:yes gene_type:complete
MESYKQAPWRNPVEETSTYLVFEDKFPVTEGHLLFVPKNKGLTALTECYRAATIKGMRLVEDGVCTAYNIGQNIGEHAGQTVMWPHVHLIPRTEGDLGRYENGTPYDPQGGVRNIIPDKGKYK